MEKRKVKGLKTKGMKNSKYDKLASQNNESDKFAPCHSEGKAKKVKTSHVGPSDSKGESVKQSEK